MQGLRSDAAFSATTSSWLSLLALVVAVLALLVAVTRRRRAAAGARGRRRPPQTVGPMSSDEVTARIEALQAVADTSLRHLAVVRYDAFGDMGGHLSWSMALLDDSGDGVVLTSIHGRSDSRTYAKNVTAWTAGQQLSPEEEEAIGFARSPGSPG